MRNPIEDAVEKVIEKAAEHLIGQLRGRTPEDTRFACTTVTVPDGRSGRRAGRRHDRGRRTSDDEQRVRVCVESGWRSETREDPTTGAPVTVHVSPEYSRKQVREAVHQQLEAHREQQRLLPPNERQGDRHK